MHALTALLLALTLFAHRADAAFLTPDEMRSEVSRLGMPTEGVDFIVNPDEDKPNAFFLPAGIYCYFIFCEEVSTTIGFFGPWAGTSYEVRLWTLLHELGHYRQHLDGRPFDEWDADVFAASAMCRRGLDGVYWATRAMEYLHGGVWDYESKSHGSALQRVENVRAKAACGGAQS